MTKQESFKRAVRARMEKTGEKYGAARRALIEAADNGHEPAPWVEQPEYSDDAVTEATGRGWDEWCALIDRWPERSEGHAAMAARLGRDHLDNEWWAQTVIVGYERIRGLRTLYQQSDGTFAGSVTRTIATDSDWLDGQLRDPDAATAIVAEFDPGVEPTVAVRSRPTSKAIRWAIDPDGGSPQFSIGRLDDGRVRVSIQHQRLGSTADVERWKAFWARWLEDLDGLG